MGLDALPAVADLRRAVEIYLHCAYSAGKVPPAIQQRVEQLAAAGAQPWDAEVFERTTVPTGTRYALRLGNSAYPHMKLAIEPSPDGAQGLFRVDTHDRHIRPTPGSRDAAAFAAMQQRNGEIAAEVEAEWGRKGLLTFKEYLRRDLERRARESAEV